MKISIDLTLFDHADEAKWSYASNGSDLIIVQSVDGANVQVTLKNIVNPNAFVFNAITARQALQQRLTSGGDQTP